MTKRKKSDQPLPDYGISLPAKRRVWHCANCGILGDVGANPDVRWLASDEWQCRRCGGTVTRKTIDV